LPLGGSGVVLKPEIDVDLKSGKLKSLGAYGPCRRDGASGQAIDA